MAPASHPTAIYASVDYRSVSIYASVDWLVEEPIRVTMRLTRRSCEPRPKCHAARPTGLTGRPRSGQLRSRTMTRPLPVRGNS